MNDFSNRNKDWYYDFDTSIYDHRTAPELLCTSKRNLRGLIALVNRMFEHRSNILVVRVDLTYRAEFKESVPLELAQIHRERLLADRRYYPDVFHGLMGYAWCLEPSERSGGYHYHLIAFYEGRLQKNAVGLGMGIKFLWDGDITGGIGNCSVINLDAHKFRKNGTLGIGMIHRNDFEARRNLVERVLPYITKKCPFSEVYSDLTATGDFRTFGKSQFLAPIDRNVPRRGRPPLN
jgi:hypothetical protein